MPKILVLSDLHYPSPISSHFKNIIKKEHPDIVVLLGDVIDDSKSKASMLNLYKEFIKKFKSVFPIEKSIILLGDNEGRMKDYTINKKISDYLSTLKKINKNNITYTYKNLFFFHGNIERSFFQERMGYFIGKIALSIHKKLLPYTLMKMIRIKFKLSNNTIPLIGHIHYLGIVDNGVFCGTLHKQKILYEKQKSLGYVVINDDKPKISISDIKLVTSSI
jgi:predicted phosphodiesterase